MEREKKYKIIQTIGRKQYFYTGHIRAEDDMFITFWDYKIGILRLKRSTIDQLMEVND